ncbi:MAG: biotin--[acetyl-CoA-carboxylase] ligase [Bacillota bacterium]
MNKDEILCLLKDGSDKYISGGEICKKLGISRTAVWKHIRSLQEEGYGIDAVPSRGYRLVSVPDRLYPSEIAYGLNTEFTGKEIYYFDSVESTNREARKLAAEGVPGGTLVVAEEQTGGRGRLGRGWFSPKGLGIWCSLVIRPEIIPGEAPPVTMLTAVAVASAVEKVAGIKPGIKWPNDILVGGKKVCGILTEMSAEMERINFLIVGVGINVNIPEECFPEELKDIAASLHCFGKGPLSRLELLRQFLSDFELSYSIWMERGFGPVLEEWRRRCVTLHRRVRLYTVRETWEGLAEDVDQSGALLLRLPDGTVKPFVAGEVSLKSE